MHDWRETLEWYKTHNTAREIGFNPDNMCLKVCRTARLIGPGALTAKISQDATPKAHRVHRVRDLRKGMVLYFDDPNDSNKAGHVVTMIGRVPGFDWDDLDDVLVETNSVVSGRLVVVRASYFLKHWGDPFQFGATWLNGQVLDVNEVRTRVVRFKKSGPKFDVGLLDAAIEKGHRSDLRKYVNRIEDAVADLPDDKRRTKLVEFTETFEKKRVLDMPLLREASENAPKVQDVQKRLNSIIKSVPPA